MLDLAIELQPGRIGQRMSGLVLNATDTSLGGCLPRVATRGRKTRNQGLNVSTGRGDGRSGVRPPGDFRFQPPGECPCIDQAGDADRRRVIDGLNLITGIDGIEQRDAAGDALIER